VINQLELQMQGTPAERIAQAAHQSIEPVNRQALQKQVGMSDQELDDALSDAIAHNQLVEIQPAQYLSAERFVSLQHQIIRALTTFHQQQPLQQGMPREQMRSQLGIRQATFTALLENHDNLVAEGNFLRVTHHRVRFTPAQQAAIDRLKQDLQSQPYTPPSTAEAGAIVGEAVLNAMAESGEIIRVQPEIIFSRAAYEEMVAFVLSYLNETGSISAAELRDHFQTTRKYTIGLLEYLDSIKVTRRQGDSRVRGPNA
jgi:selenocysteine-specific elongation factor